MWGSMWGELSKLEKKTKLQSLAEECEGVPGSQLSVSHLPFRGRLRQATAQQKQHLTCS